MNETDLIIKATTLLAKDLIVDGNIRKTLLKFQSNLQQTVAEEENDERKSTDDDIELLLMRKFLTKKRNFAGSDNTKVAKKSKLSVHNKLNPSSRKSYSKMNSTSTASEIVLQNTMKSKSKPRIKSNVQPEPKRLPDNNYQYFIFLQQCDDLTFQNQFKFTKKTFEAFQQKMCPLLKIVLQNKQSIDNRLTESQLLLCSIWIMTTKESIYKIAERFSLTMEQLYHGFRFVCDAISSNKHIFIKWPNEDDAIQIMEQFDQELNSSQLAAKKNDDQPPSTTFPNVCGIIGCTNIQIPLTDDCANNDGDSSDEKFSIVKLQIICDAKDLLLDTHVEQIETISNVMVFNKSAIKRMLDRNPYALPIDGHLIGDKTYPLKTFLMVPFKENRKSDEMNQYNSSLMKTRKNINRTFKQLKERFSRLNFINMNVSAMELSQCIEMACVIHNFCIQNLDEYCLQIDDDDNNIPISRAICRDFTIDQRAIDKRNRILDNFKIKHKN